MPWLQVLELTVLQLHFSVQVVNSFRVVSKPSFAKKLAYSLGNIAVRTSHRYQGPGARVTQLPKRTRAQNH